MHLPVQGHPIHTRALAVELRQGTGDLIAASGYVLDLRQRGVVPVAADLQGPGIVHHMLLDTTIEPRRRTLEAIAARQPQVAFEPSAVTAGESCRDPVARLAALRGSVLDQDWARRLGAEFGGPRGCSHLLTLAQLLGSTAVWALDRTAPGARRQGERLFRRDIVLDAHNAPGRRFDIAIQVTDMTFAPAEEIAHPMQRFGRQHEVRAMARLDLTTLALATLDVAERQRTAGEVGADGWRLRPDVAEGLVGRSAIRGSSAVLLERLAAAPADLPIYDGLLMLAPAMIQCFATLSDGWLGETRDADTRLGIGGIPDSCYMWRRGGGLDRARRPGDPMPGIGK
jgi:hypothetical protein